MDSVISRALKARARLRADRRALERRFSYSLDKPEPPESYLQYRLGPRWRLWIFTASVLTATGGVAAVLSQDQPRRPLPSVPVTPVAEVGIAPDPTSLGRSVPAPEFEPVRLPAPRVETATVPLPERAVPAAPAMREVVTAARSGANMRSEPSMSGTVVWTAPRGTRLRVVEEEGIWLQVATPSGHRAGWMHRSVVAE